LKTTPSIFENKTFLKSINFLLQYLSETFFSICPKKVFIHYLACISIKKLKKNIYNEVASENNETKKRLDLTSTQKQVTSNLAHVYVRLYVRILHNLYVNMHPYENVELLDMLLVFGEARHNAQEAQRIYRERYPNRQQPSSQLFRKICRRLLETGCFYPTTGGNANRVHRTPRFEEAVLNIIEDEPSTSTRIIGNRLNVNHVSVWQVLKEQGLYPYSRQKVQALGPDDFQPRLLFCRWLLRRCNLRRHFEKFVLFTDEACFTRNGVFNSKIIICGLTRIPTHHLFAHINNVLR